MAAGRATMKGSTSVASSAAPPSAAAATAARGQAVGSMQKAVIKDGEGDSLPRDGDQIVLHYTTSSGGGGVMGSTRTEHGGSGCPLRFVLGCCRLLPAWDAAVRSMRQGELSVIKVQLQPGESGLGHPFHGQDLGSGADGKKILEGELCFELELLRVAPVKILTRGQRRREGEEERVEEEGVEGREEEDDVSVTKQVLEEGEGFENPRPPSAVKILLDVFRLGSKSKLFACPDALVLTLGKQEMPLALELSLKSMRRNERCIVFASGPKFLQSAAATCPSWPLPAIPDDVGDVEFHVRLLQIMQVRDVMGDGSVVKRRVREGRGEFPVDCPLDDCRVRFHLRGSLPERGGEVFLDTRQGGGGGGEGGGEGEGGGGEGGGEPLEVATGEGKLPPGLETSIRLMLPGEVAVISSTGTHAYDNFHPRPEGVADGERVEWEVELLSFQRDKEWDGLSFDEILSEVQRLREVANDVFRRGHFKFARQKYEKILRELRNVHPQNEEEGKEWQNSKVLLELNVAACHHKQQDFVEAIERADKVLHESPYHPKALYRRGLSRMMMNDFEEAREDFELMMKSDPTTEVDGRLCLQKLKKHEEDAKKKEVRQFKGFLQRDETIASAKAKEQKAIAIEETTDIKVGNKETLNQLKEGFKVSSVIPIVILFSMISLLLLLAFGGQNNETEL